MQHVWKGHLYFPLRLSFAMLHRVVLNLMMLLLRPPCLLNSWDCRHVQPCLSELLSFALGMLCWMLF